MRKFRRKNHALVVVLLALAHATCPSTVAGDGLRDPPRRKWVGSLSGVGSRGGARALTDSSNLNLCGICARGVSLMLAATPCACTNLIREPMSLPGTTDAPDLPDFVGKNRSPSGRGVDLCLHGDAVRRNPHGNPRLAWDNDHCFTVMGHSGNDPMLGPVLMDQRSDPMLPVSASALARLIEEDPLLRGKLAASQSVVLYSCNAGALTPQGMPSFAARLANTVHKPVIAPTNRLIMSDGTGEVAGSGKYRIFFP